jgi:hypothetical protein
MMTATLVHIQSTSARMQHGVRAAGWWLQATECTGAGSSTAPAQTDDAFPCCALLLSRIIATTERYCCAYALLRECCCIATNSCRLVLLRIGYRCSQHVGEFHGGLAQQDITKLLWIERRWKCDSAWTLQADSAWIVLRTAGGSGGAPANCSDGKAVPASQQTPVTVRTSTHV